VTIGGYPIFRLGAGDVERVHSLMSLVPHQDGKTLQAASVTDDSNPHLISRSDAYKCWSRVVEIYSQTQLLYPSDKLIALSGIAKTISRQIDDTYIVGMWKKYPASQLLWRVDPVYENGQFSYLSKRSKDYRAPTFSWAAVEADRGIKYGEFTDQDLLIEVKEIEVTPERTEDEFGVVKKGYLKLSGVFKKIEMNVSTKDGVTCYGWHLVRYGIGAKLSIYKNVCLDSPKSDPDILGPDGQVYCLPARKDSAGYLICLLLQLEKKDNIETGNFRRIGVTKIPSHGGGQESVCQLWGDEPAMPYGNWDTEHTICLV